MKHKLKILVKKGPPSMVGTDSGELVYCRKLHFREKLLRLMFGERRTVTVIVPGDSVECVSVTELTSRSSADKGGEKDEK